MESSDVLKKIAIEESQDLQSEEQENKNAQCTNESQGNLHENHTNESEKNNVDRQAIIGNQEAGELQGTLNNSQELKEPIIGEIKDSFPKQEQGQSSEPDSNDCKIAVNNDLASAEMMDQNDSHSRLVNNGNAGKIYPGKGGNSFTNHRVHDNAFVAFVKKNLLVVLIVTGALIGFIIGISINESVQKLNPEQRYNVIVLIGFPGELLLRMLKMLILPLITFSLIIGVAGLDGKVSGKIGGRAVVYYLGTTCVAAVMGLILVSAIRPGNAITPPANSEEQQLVRPLDSFMDIVRNLFPSNIVKACVEQDKTKIVEINGELLRKNLIPMDVSNMSTEHIDSMVKKGELVRETNAQGSTLQIIYKKVINEYRVYKIGKGLIQTSTANFLGLIVFAIAVGKIAGSLGSEADVFIQFIAVFNKIVTRLVVIVMWYSPIGIGSLIMAKFAEMKDIHDTFSGLALFIVTVVLGVGMHGLLVLPGIYFLFTRSNPYRYFMGVTPAMATAFGTDSSAATLPTTLRCLEENLKIDKRITRFIVPVGATINMDGTALYEAVSAIFIAQSVGRTLSFGDYIAISFTSILASVGAAAIPHAGLVTMLIVLDTVGLPTDMIAVIFSVDWFLDRLRTMCNVLGDAYGAGIVQHLSKADLQRADELEAMEKINGDVHVHDDEILDKTDSSGNQAMTYC